MFLVRHVEKSEAIRLQTIGYTFAPLDHVVGNIAGSMQITSEELKPYLEETRTFPEMPKPVEPGVHIACFALRPIIGGFEILGRKDTRNQLPSVKLPISKLERWQIAMLSPYEDWEAQALLNYWNLDSTQNALTKEQKIFVADISAAMRHLQRRVGDEIFGRARLVAKPLQQPCAISAKTSTDSQTITHPTASVIAFRMVTDIHFVHPVDMPDIFLNSRLFTTQQHCYAGSPDHAVFSGRVHQEFGSILESQSRDRHGRRRLDLLDTDQKSIRKRFSFVHHKTPSSPFTFDNGSGKDISRTSLHLGDDISEKHLVTNGSENPFGGVHVSNEISISVADIESVTTPGLGGPNVGSGIEMSDLGLKTEIGRVSEKESAIDTLMTLTLERLKN
jgi:hypothetical protein